MAKVTQWIVAPTRTVHLAPTGDLAVVIVERIPNASEPEAMVEIRTYEEARALIVALAERFNIPVQIGANQYPEAR